MLGNDLFGDEIPQAKHGSRLSDTWDYPPFSVWNARDGWWQDRKREWLSLGIKSELGRGGGGQHGTSGLTWGDRPQITEIGLNFYRKKSDKNG